MNKPANPDRVSETYQLLCRGLNRAAIIRYANEKAWEATELQIDAFIDAAIAELAKSAGVDLESELGKSIERLNYLYMQCDKVHDFKTGLAIQKELNKMLELKVKAASLRAVGQQPAKEPRKGISLVS